MNNEQEVNMEQQTNQQTQQQQFNYEQFYGNIPYAATYNRVSFSDSLWEKIEKGYYFALTHKREIIEGIGAAAVFVAGTIIGGKYIKQKYINPKHPARIRIGVISDGNRNCCAITGTAYDTFGREYDRATFITNDSIRDFFKIAHNQYITLSENGTFDKIENGTFDKIENVASGGKYKTNK